MNSLDQQKPKYVSIADALRREIQTGGMKAGDRLPPYGEAQQRYGTTKATLERAHALLEQDGLITRRPGSGVFVAHPQRRPRTGIIGVIHVPLSKQGGFPGVAHSSYESHLLHAVRTTAMSQDVEVLLLNDKPSAGWEKVDGILAHGHGADHVQAFGARIPTVVMMHALDGIPSVIADDTQGTRQATEHLISLGHSKIAYLLDASEGNPLSRQRLAGYHAALGNAGLRGEKAWIGDLRNYGSMHRRGLLSMRRWLKKGFSDTGCTALLVQNDLAAIGAMEALREAGIDIPKQMSVVGFDSTDECQLVAPQLTSVRVPLEEIGTCATDLLLRQINNEEVSSTPTVFQTRLEVRKSTAPPHSATPRRKTLP